MIGMRLSHSVSPRIEVSQRLTVGQRLEIKQTMLTLRLDLIGAVHGGDYKPRAQCPKCERVLTALEIIQGFRQDPNDYTTECTFCHSRFEPKLIWRSGESRAEIPFYCPSQVLYQLHGLEGKTPDEIQKEYPAIYHSVRVHHGNLRRAFEKVDIQYQYESVVNWKERVNDFLGKLPDTVIAEVVDLSVKAVRDLRRSLGISPFSHRSLVNETS